MAPITSARINPPALRFMSCLLSFLPALVLALSLSPVVDAQERPAQEGKGRKDLQVTVEPCFGEQCTQGWYPVAVTMDNRTGNEVRGALTIVLDTLVRWNEGEGDMATRMPIVCARGTTKRFVIYAQLHGYGSEYYYGSYITGARVEFWEAGESKASFQHDLRMEFEGEPGLLVLSRSPNLMATYAIPTTSGRTKRPMRGAVNTLPDRSQGYDQVSLIVASADFPFEELTPEQKSALVEWVKLGGTCIVFPTTDPARLRIEPLKSLLSDADIVQVDSALPMLKKTLGEKTWPFDEPGNRVRKMIDGVPVSIDRDKDGTEFAVCSVRPFGMGAVGFLGIECENATYALLMSGGGFWSAILDPVRESACSHAGRNALYRARNFSSGSETHAKIQNGMSSMPSVVFIAIFMIAYIVVVCPVNFLVLRRFKRNPWVVISVPLVSLAFVGVLFAYAYLERGSADKLRRVAIVETVSGGDFGFEYECGVFMAGNGRLCRLEYANGVPVFPYEDREDAGSKGVVEQSGSFALADVAMRNWEMLGFGMRGCRDLQGSIAVLDAAGSVKVVNELPVGVARGILVSMSSMTFVDVPAIASGASSTVDRSAFDAALGFTGANTGRLFDRDTRGVAPDALERAQHYFEQCQEIVAGAKKTGYVFIGVLEKPYQQLVVTPGSKPETEEICFIVVVPK